MRDQNYPNTFEVEFKPLFKNVQKLGQFFFMSSLRTSVKATS